MNINHDLVQLAATFVGGIGFAMMLKMRKKQILFGALAGAITWIFYLGFYFLFMNIFLANFLAAIVAGILAEVMARKRRSPATIYLTAAGIPLFPGAKLYYCMFGMVTEQTLMAEKNGIEALIIATAIALGYVIVAVFNKYISRMLDMRPQKALKKVVNITSGGIKKLKK